MPAHTQTWRAEDKHTDRQTSADNTALGFRAPWVFLPAGTRFTSLNGFHCSPDLGSGEELCFPQSQLPSSALADLGLVPAGTSSPFPTLHRKLSPVPGTSLPLSRAPDLRSTFLSCLSTGATSILPLSWKCSLPLVKGSQTSPQMLCPLSESPSRKREGELHCLGGLLSSCSGIQTSGITKLLFI